MQRPWFRDGLVVFLADLFTGSLARQSLLGSTLVSRFQIERMLLDILDDVFLLDLPFKAAQRIFKRLAFLYTNFCQKLSTSKPARGQLL